MVVGDDSFTLVLNGASYRLLPDGNGRWRTEQDAYLIRHRPIVDLALVAPYGHQHF